MAQKQVDDDQTLNNRGRRHAKMFNRDVILLTDCQQQSTLTGRMKGKAYEEGNY